MLRFRLPKNFGMKSIIYFNTSRQLHHAELLLGLSGTGKTQNLIKKALKSSETQNLQGECHQLLVMTSSSKEANFFQSQIDLVRPLGCSTIQVKTYGQLAQDVIKGHGHILSRVHYSKLLSRLDMQVFLQRRLASLPLQNLFPTGFSTNEKSSIVATELLNFFERLDLGNISSEAYTKFAEDLLSRTVDNILAIKDQALLEQARIEVEKAEAYKAFIELKQTENVHGWTDEILAARDILSANALAREELIKQTSMLLVDNLHFLSPLMVNFLTWQSTGHGRIPIIASADPFVPSCSIRRFSVYRDIEKGISPLQLFLAYYPNAVVTPLLLNYRCDEAIQEVMHHQRPSVLPSHFNDECSSHLPGSYLFALNAICKSPIKIENSRRISSMSYPNRLVELESLSILIADIAKVQPGGIAVIVPKSQDVEIVLSALAVHGLPAWAPFQSNHNLNSNFRKNRAVNAVFSALRCILYPTEDPPLLVLLQYCPAYKLPNEILSRIVEIHLSRFESIKELIERISNDKFDMLSNSFISEENTRKAKKVAALFSQHLNKLQKMTLEGRHSAREIISQFLLQSGLQEHCLNPTSEEDEENADALAQLFAAVQFAEFDTGSDSLIVVEPVLRIFKQHYREHSNQFHINDDNTSKHENCVWVFPINKIRQIPNRSFDTIMLPFLMQRNFPGNFRQENLSVPLSLFNDNSIEGSVLADKKDFQIRHKDYQRSIFYAAISRARSNIILSCSDQGPREKHSEFLQGILQPVKIEMPRAESDIPMRYKATLEEAKFDTYDDIGLYKCEELVELSYSSVYAYKRCPYSYRYSHILNITPSMAPLASYGQGMHKAVSALLLSSAEPHFNHDQALDNALQLFQKTMEESIFESHDQIKHLRTAGKNGLRSFAERLWKNSDLPELLSCHTSQMMKKHIPIEFTTHSGDSRKVLSEYSFSVKIPSASISFRGIIDRIDLEYNNSGCLESITITDYKSNVATKNPLKMTRESLQLQLYAWAVRELTGMMPSHLSIESIEDGRKGVVPSCEIDIDGAFTIVSEVAENIKKRKFAPTPSFMGCKHCGFRHICEHSVSP